MNIRTLAGLSAFAAGLAAAPFAAAGVTYVGPVSVSYYSSTGQTGCTGPSSQNCSYGDYTDTGTGITFTDASSTTDQIGAISELRDYYAGADSDPNWPSATFAFGADFTATISAPTTGDYTFNFGTDDGGYLLIDGDVVANQGGIHAIAFQDYVVNLTAGTHTLEVQYDNVLCCGAIAYVGLNGALAPVPEPASWALMVLGLGAVGATLRKLRMRRPLAVAPT